MALIAVTGATGFIGRQFVAQCLARRHEVRPITRADLQRGGVEPYAGAAAVVHLAGRAHVLEETEADPAAAFHRVNVELTQRVYLDSVAAGVRRFVFMSSAGVLGDASPPGGFDDQSPARPYNDYSRSKYQAEQWLAGRGDAQVTRVVVRPPVVYGPGARGNFGRILTAARRGVPLPTGGLRAPRSMIGLRNLCDFIAVAALDPRATSDSFLVSDERVLSVHELSDTLRTLFGRSPFSLNVPASLLGAVLRMVGRGADAVRLTAPFELRPARVRQVFGWQPPFSCPDELAWTVATMSQIALSAPSDAGT